MVKTMYVTDDGKEFENFTTASEHDNVLKYGAFMVKWGGDHKHEQSMENTFRANEEFFSKHFDF